MSSIDPRALSQLLQLQILSSSPLLSSSAQASTGESDFAGLLELLVTQQETESLTDSQASSTPRSLIRPALLPYMTETHDDSVSYKGAAPFTEFIESASRRFGVDSRLIYAVTAAESSFNPEAVSPAGAKGLMQLMDATGASMGVTNPFDPKQNIDGGTRYLSRLLMKYEGNEMTALAAYNAGPSRVDKLGISNDAELMTKLSELPRETQRYIQKVLQLKESAVAAGAE